MYLEQIECFGGPPGHLAIGCRRIVGYIFIPQYIHAGLSLKEKVVERIGSLILNVKGFADECI